MSQEHTALGRAAGSLSSSDQSVDLPVCAARNACVDQDGSHPDRGEGIPHLVNAPHDKRRHAHSLGYFGKVDRTITHYISTALILRLLELDQTKCRVVEHDDDDVKSESRKSLQFASNHAKAAVTNQTRGTSARPRECQPD